MTSTDQAPATRPWQDPSRSVAERVDALLSVMTLPEKTAQLGSTWPGRQEDDEIVAPAAGGDPARAEDPPGVFADGLGHFTRIFGTRPVSPAEGMAAVRDAQQRLLSDSRLGIPAIVHEECLTGFTTLGATTHPTAIAWAATFDPALVQRMAAAIGTDMHAVGVHQGLSPVLDVVRDHRWGRVEETLGEDPYLVAQLATAYVRGLQSAGVDATLKHFAGYSASRAGRNHAPVSMGPREFADVVLAPFEAAVRDGGVVSVMNSYADVDGVPAAGNGALLTDLLRGELGFDGVVVSDYFAVAFLETMHHVAGSPAAAGALALTAGIDVELPVTHAFAGLAGLVAAGELDEAVVDRAVRRVLSQKAAHGLLDADWSPVPPAMAAGTPVDLDAPAGRAIARELAETSVVLLANDGTLPLAGPAAPARIALVGPGADDPSVLFGCYAFANHVLGAGQPGHRGQRFGLGIGIEAPTVADALRAEFPEAAIEVVPGCAVQGEDTTGFAAATAAARGADLVVAVVGDRAALFGHGTSGEGCDAPDLTLPGVQGALLTELLATGTPVVLVVVSGRPYALGAHTGAVASVQAFFPGEEGAGAIAGVLSGRVTPSGKLPVQVAAVPGSGPGTYLHSHLAGQESGSSNLDPTPLYPFGHGLSYTSFAFSDLTLSEDSVATDGSVTVGATVRNSGDRAGAEVVQLYLSDPVASVVRPVRQLVGFVRVPLAAGAAARVGFRLHADRTAFTGPALTRIVEPGEIRLAVGSSSVDLPLSASVTLTGPTRTVGHGRVLDTPVTVTPVP